MKKMGLKKVGENSEINQKPTFIMTKKQEKTAIFIAVGLLWLEIELFNLFLDFFNIQFFLFNL